MSDSIDCFNCLIKIISNSKILSFCKLTSSPLDINCLFEPAYYWGFTMLKHVKTGYYVGCDYTGKTTLVKNSMPNYPNPEILFIVNAPDLI